MWCVGRGGEGGEAERESPCPGQAEQASRRSRRRGKCAWRSFRRGRNGGLSGDGRQAGGQGPRASAGLACLLLATSPPHAHTHSPAARPPFLLPSFLASDENAAAGGSAGDAITQRRGADRGFPVQSAGSAGAERVGSSSPTPPCPREGCCWRRWFLGKPWLRNGEQLGPGGMRGERGSSGSSYAKWEGGPAPRSGRWDLAPDRPPGQTCLLGLAIFFRGLGIFRGDFV